MKKTFIKIVSGLLILLLVGLGSWWAGFKFKAFEIQREQNVSVVLEKIERVFKFVAVEGQVSEIFNHKEYYAYDLPIFTKKALIRVNAKISVGYDFEKVKISTNSETGQVIMSKFPKAEILSVDHDLDYYDITQGAFNTFTEKDYNEINKNAKDFASQKAIQGDLLAEAESQKEELLEMIRGVLMTMGYELVVEDQVLDKLLN